MDRTGRDRLAERAAADLSATFSEIVTGQGPAVYTTALRLTRHHADAEDLAADTFVRAYRALATYPPERIRQLRLRPWLVTITLNLWRNRGRDRRRRPATVPAGGAGAPGAVADPAAGPEEVAVERDGAAELARLLGALPEAQRVAVVLRHVVGMPYAEVAEVLGVPAGTAKSHVSRGLAALRARMAVTEEERSS